MNDISSIEVVYNDSKEDINVVIDSYKERYNKHPNLEVIIEANEEAMICKYNMLKKYNKNEGYLIDRFNNKYKIKVKNNSVLKLFVLKLLSLFRLLYNK